MCYSLLAHVSKSKTLVGKVFWAICVTFCFSISFWLIMKSWTEWRESPFSSTISTHPISDLDFPKLTVCPPKGSHTALNYDLIKAEEGSLSQFDKQTLANLTRQVFITDPHNEFIKLN